MDAQKTRTRKLYEQAAKALDEAHQACFKHPDRGPIGMSHGPFSGVNEALGIIAMLEEERDELAAKLAAGWRIIAPGEMDRETVERCAKVADEAQQMRERLYSENQASINAHAAVQAEVIAAAIRALAEPKP